MPGIDPAAPDATSRQSHRAGWNLVSGRGRMTFADLAGRGDRRCARALKHFYLTKVGLGEGCGCAEHVTRIREIDSYAASRARSSHGHESAHG